MDKELREHFQEKLEKQGHKLQDAITKAKNELYKASGKELTGTEQIYEVEKEATQLLNVGRTIIFNDIE